MNKLVPRFLVAWLSVAVCIPAASASIIYVADYEGDVVQYNTATGAIAQTGNLSGFTVGRVIGLAWDPATRSILILDRNAYTVYSMDPETGSVSPLFTTFIGPNPQPWEKREFQGGAVKNGLLYGFDEITQTLEAYSLETGVDQELSGSFATEHSHAVGVDRESGQLYGLGGAGLFRELSDDGTFGPVVVTASNAAFYYDVDYHDGGFVGTLPERGIDLIDLSGNVSVLVTAEALAPFGFGTGSGIAVDSPSTSSVAPLSLVSAPRAFPNPTRSTVQVSFRVNANALAVNGEHIVEASVYNASGRLVRKLSHREVVAGERVSMYWDGLDRRGRRAPAGLFFIRVHVDGSSPSTVKLVRLSN